MDLRGALAPRATRNHPSITEPVKVGQLLRTIDGYEGQIATHAALRIAPYVFVRPGELRAAEWSEFDFVVGDWRIPGKRAAYRSSGDAGHGDTAGVAARDRRWRLLLSSARYWSQTAVRQHAERRVAASRLFRR
jgi:integrase